MELKSGYPPRVEASGVGPKLLVTPYTRWQKKSVRRLVAESNYWLAD